MNNELEGYIYDIKWTKVAENKVRRWDFVMMVMNSIFRKGTWQTVTVRISPVVAWNLIWTLLVQYFRFIFQSNTQYTRYYGHSDMFGYANAIFRKYIPSWQRSDYNVI